MYWITSGMDVDADAGEPPEVQIGGFVPVSSIGPGTMLGQNWRGAVDFLQRSRQRYVVIDAKNGLGNRLRTVASAMSVAEYLGRPVLLVWMPDLHLNCSISQMFAQPLPFALLEIEIPRAYLSSGNFQYFNYMRPEPGAIKDEPVDVDPDRHLFFRSAFVMNHPLGAWASGGPQRQILRLRPVQAVQRLLVADASMVGLHVRNVFDAPRDTESNRSTEGKSAMEGANKEYGMEGTQKLLEWRRASHCAHAIPRAGLLVVCRRSRRHRSSRTHTHAHAHAHARACACACARAPRARTHTSAERSPW